MSYLQGSPQYVWSTTCVLGKGATGAVYQGVHKNTGEPVAVKTFNQLSHMRPYEVQIREFEVMKRLNHPNIVKMLAIEEEITGTGVLKKRVQNYRMKNGFAMLDTLRHRQVGNENKVLVMELCTGGSLFNILDDPQNSYGLEENEFLSVLRDLSAGMKYLRDNNIIHRDLKPGNIMKFITEDGRSIYKLTDFGAARELEDDQQFVSLYGTEEYLHPDMYERAVLRRQPGKSFRATVDLWSIGVTLYHVATGSLPFRPYGGRKNKETMYHITTKKASGVISGVQYSENGPIEWSKDLPKTCLLNQGLQELVTSLLAGLLECNNEKIWTFDHFFEHVTDIVSRKVLHIFYVNEGKEITIYLQPNKTLHEAKEQITVQTGVPITSQLILFEKDKLDNLVEPIQEVSTYPHITHQSPLFLYNKDTTEVKSPQGVGALSARFPTFHSKTQFSSVNLEHDAAMAKTCCSVGHAVKRLVEKLVHCHKLMLQAPLTLVHIVADNVKQLGASFEKVMSEADGLDQHLKHLVNLHSTVLELLSLFPAKHNYDDNLQCLQQIITDKQQRKAAVRHHIDTTQSAIQLLQMKVVHSNQLKLQWEQLASDIPQLQGCIEKAATYVNKIRDSWQSLVRDKGIRTLSFHDEQFHMLERIKIEQTSKKLLSLLQEQCLKTCQITAQKLDEWYSGVQVTMVKCGCLEEDLITNQNLVAGYSSSLNKADKEFESSLNKVVASLRSSQLEAEKNASPIKSLETNSTNKYVSANKLPSSLLYDLKELRNAQTEVWDMLRENNEMIAQFQVFATQLSQSKMNGISLEGDNAETLRISSDS